MMVVDLLLGRTTLFGLRKDLTNGFLRQEIRDENCSLGNTGSF